MELLVFLAVVICVVVFRRFSSSRVRAAASDLQRIMEIGDPAIAHRAIIENADAFSNRPSAVFPVALVTGRRRRRSDNMTTVPYGPHWRVLRRNITTEILHPSRLSFFAPLQRAAVDALVADLSPARGAAEVVVVRGHLYDAVFGLVARLCFGDGADERDVRAARLVMQEFVLGVGQAQAYGGSKVAKLLHWRRWRRFLASRARMAEAFSPLIAARRRSRICEGEVRPYVDSLLDLHLPPDEEDGGNDRALNDDEMVSLVSEFLGAGTETVVACVEWTLAHLATQPEVQNKLRRELHLHDRELLWHRGMQYLHAVVLESLRMHPPVPFIMRDVRDPLGAAVLGESTLPAGGLRVHFMLGAIGRDRKTWMDPDEFRPERFLAGGEGEDVGPLPGPKEIRMMPFGAGRRYCPGMGLGMLHVKCFLTALVREFEWAQPVNQDVDFTELDGFFKTMKTPLRACLTWPPAA